MFHIRQGLPFCLKLRNNLLGVHAQLDNLKCHFPAHGLRLLGNVNDAHAPFANQLANLVTAKGLYRWLDV